MTDLPFDVTSGPRAKQQLRTIAMKAVAFGIQEATEKELSVIAHRLRTNPSNFGEPKYRTKKPGGVVHQAIHRPFSVTFAYYEAEKVVFILDVIPLPGTPLE